MTRRRDLIFNPGRRLRVSIGGDILLWISWGWRAEKQFHLSRSWYCRWVNRPEVFSFHFGPVGWTIWS